MSQDNNSTQSPKDILTKANKIIGTKNLFLIIFAIAAAIVIFISSNVYESKTEIYKNEVFVKVNDEILERFETMLNEKISTSVLISSSLSKNVNIKKALMANRSTILDMEKLLDEMKTSKEYVDIQAEIIDADGISFKRSWTHLAGDDLVKDNSKMAHLIKYPRVSTKIEATKYGVTISNKIPIYNDDEFLGLFGVNIHFDALVDIFAKEGFDSVVLLNQEDSKKIIQDISYSKKFVGNCYVVNSNANDYLLKILKNEKEIFCGDAWEKSYKINEQTSHLISKYIIKDDTGDNLAKIIIFKSLEEIDFEDLSFMQNAHIVATICFLLLVAFIINYLYVLSEIKTLKIENEELIHVNDDLKTKTDEMDFNDKKLDNLFNMQPNLMFMHNGKELTKVNKRFMGFFNRFGTFDGFKKKHKCVSELFEKYEAPNYIWEQYLENEFWIDYILKNPRRLYKTVMSINGDPHHFIIKLNEMKYAKHVTERVIIVALVDMTQDLVNYKTLDETSKVLDTINEKLELKEEKENTDISYEVQTKIQDTLEELTDHKIVNKHFEKINPNELKGINAVKVVGNLKFSDVESDWNFYVPALTSAILLNVMMGTGDSEVDDRVDKDILDTSREFISAISVALCDEINKKEFHDLKDAKYNESTLEEFNRKEVLDLENLYRIVFELDDGNEIEFYSNLSNDIMPFMKQIVDGEEIKLYEKKEKEIKPSDTIKEDIEETKEEDKLEALQETQVPQKKEKESSEETKDTNEIEKIDQKKENKSIEEIEKTEESKEKKEEPVSVAVKAKPISVKPKLVKQKQSVEQVKKSNKLDAYALVQRSFQGVLKDTLEKEIQIGNLRGCDSKLLTGQNCVQFDNKFNLIAQKQELNWTLLLPAKSLSSILNIMMDDLNADAVEELDESLENLAKEIISLIAKNIAIETKNKISLTYSDIMLKNNILLEEDKKVFDIAINVNENSIPIYIVL